MTGSPYGRPHRRRAELAWAMFRPGDICPYFALGQCKYEDGRMYLSQGLDRCHVRSVALGSDGTVVIGHAACNRAAGARLGNAMRKHGIKPKPKPKTAGNKTMTAAQQRELKARSAKWS